MIKEVSVPFECIQMALTMKTFTFPWTLSGREKYTLFRDGNTQIQPKGITPWSLPSRTIFVLTLCLASSLAGFGLRSWLDEAHQQPKTEASQIPLALRPAGTVIKTFKFNEIYSIPPRNESNRAWADNLPSEHSSLRQVYMGRRKEES